MKQVKEGYKMTELGEIPNEWEVCQLDTNAKINPESLSVKAPKDLKISYIDIESVSTGKINGFKQYVFEEAPSRARRIVKKNDIIISTVRPYLKAFAMVKENINNLVCSTGFAVVRCNKNQDCRYIYQYVLSDGYIEQLKNKMVGSNYPAVNSNDIKESLVIFPTLPEQQKIADILSTVDEQIDNVDRLIEKTKELKKGLMQQLLTKGIGHTEFKETEVGVIPKEWEVKKLGEIASFCSNGFVGTATPFYTEDEDGIPYLMSNSVRANYIDKSNMMKVKQEFATKYPKTTIFEGDMLTVQSGHIGTSCIVTKEYDGANCHAIIITRFNEYISSRFVSQYLNSTIGKSRLANIFVGTTIKHINVKDFIKFNVPVPQLSEQVEIANLLATIDQRVDELEEKKDKLQQLKKGLMQQLLTGKIRVKVDEV